MVSRSPRPCAGYGSNTQLEFCGFTHMAQGNDTNGKLTFRDTHSDHANEDLTTATKIRCDSNMGVLRLSWFTTPTNANRCLRTTAALDSPDLWKVTNWCSKQRGNHGKIVNFLMADHIDVQAPAVIEIAHRLNAENSGDRYEWNPTSIPLQKNISSAFWFGLASFVGAIIMLILVCLCIKPRRGRAKSKHKKKKEGGDKEKGVAATEWEEHVDPETGYKYYYNSKTDQTLWESETWQEHADEETGTSYFHNFVTGQSTWRRPEGMMEGEADANPAMTSNRSVRSIRETAMAAGSQPTPPRRDDSYVRDTIALMD
eukprot:Platyproteum_vivax@DN5348_c0_g1_i1.p1